MYLIKEEIKLLVMMNLVKDMCLKLVDGINPIFRGMILMLIIVLTFMWATGFNYTNFMVAQEVIEIQKESILLSTRSEMDNDIFSNKVVKEVYATTGVYGVALFGLEPEYIPKVIHAIAKEGTNEFKDYIKIGKRYHISSTLPETYMSLREGLTHKKNVAPEVLANGAGFRSFITHPVVYRGITVGALAVFLENRIETYSDFEIRRYDAELRMACVSLSEEFYYSGNRDKK